MRIKTLVAYGLLSAGTLVTTSSYAHTHDHGHPNIRSTHYHEAPIRRASSWQRERQLWLGLHVLSNVASYQLRNEHRHIRLPRERFYPSQCLHNRGYRQHIPEAYCG